MRCLVLICVTVFLAANPGRLLAGNLFARNTGCTDGQPSCAAPPRPCVPPSPPAVCPPAPTQEIVVHVKPPPQQPVQQAPMAAVMQPAAESATSEHCSHAIEFGSITFAFPRFELPRLFRVMRNQQVSIPVAASAYVPAAQVASQAALPVATQAVPQAYAQAAIPVAMHQVVPPAAAVPATAAAAQAAPPSMTLEQLVCELRVAQARQEQQQQATQAAAAQLQQIERLEAELRRLEQLLDQQRTAPPNQSQHRQPHHSSALQYPGTQGHGPARSYPHTGALADVAQLPHVPLSEPRRGVTPARYDEATDPLTDADRSHALRPSPYPTAQRPPVAYTPAPTYPPTPRITGVTPVHSEPYRLSPAPFTPSPVQ